MQSSGALDLGGGEGESYKASSGSDGGGTVHFRDGRGSGDAPCADGKLDGGGDPPMDVHGGGAPCSGGEFDGGGDPQTEVHGDGAPEQWLWLYRDAPTSHALQKVAADWDVTVKSLDLVMPRNRCIYLLENNVPVQFVKDEMSMNILLQHGGVFADLDVLALRLPLPCRDGYLFAIEPNHTQQARYHKQYVCLSLALVGLPANSTLGQEVWYAIYRDNSAHAQAVQKGTRAPVKWNAAAQPGWMKNTKTWSEAVQRSERLDRYAADPLWFMPMGIRAKCLPERGGAPRLTSASLEPATRESVEQFSYTINTWMRHWPELLVLAVRQWLGLGWRRDSAWGARS